MSDRQTDALSPMQLDCLRYIAKGFNNNEIAGLMNFSVHHIRRITSQIFWQLGCGNRVEAAVIATREGLA